MCCCIAGVPAEEGGDPMAVSSVRSNADAWFVNVDVQWMSRGDSIQSQSLAGRNNGTPGAPGDDSSVLNTDNLRLDSTFEPQLNLGYRLDDAWSFELSYSGISSMNDEVAVAGAGDLDVPFTSLYANDFTSADVVSARYDSELRDLEFNLGYRVSPTTTYIIGVGYVGLYEDFKLHADNGQASSYNITTDNNLVGLHIGTDATFPLSQRWSVSARGRLGAFNNRVEYSQVLGDFGDTVTLRDSDDSENGFAWRGEIGVSAEYAITRQWSAWAGYRVSYVDNVYLAPDQVDFGTAPDAGTTLTREGSAFYHGPMVGVVLSIP
ncbi:MAG: BBP7 family outer membrane beta-barrel protein [Planctomycetes bacterium]|nr:BBP7 family outer membrane beta-barrel protein [Planctomycetota bacterium]